MAFFSNFHISKRKNLKLERERERENPVNLSSPYINIASSMLLEFFYEDCFLLEEFAGFQRFVVAFFFKFSH